MDPGIIDLDMPVHRVGKLAVLLAQFREDGGDLKIALAGSGVAVDALGARATRLSYRQILAIMRNVEREAPDPTIALRAGRRMHVTAYGLYGYALLSSSTMRVASEFAIKYQSIAMPLVRNALDDSQGVAIWRAEPLFALSLEDPLYRFILEFQGSLMMTVQRELLGRRYKANSLKVRYRRPAHAPAYRNIFGCQATFDQPCTEMAFDSRWFDSAPFLANPESHATARALCEEALGTIQPDLGAKGRVAQALLRTPGRFPSAHEVASELNMTTRTLHRKLERQGTSFQRMLDDVRRTLAMRYLRETVISVSEISDRLGYSSPTAFRQAFRRWTGQTPHVERAKGASGDWRETAAGE